MPPLGLNLVLVHGLWDDPLVFNGLVGFLHKEGIGTFSPHLPHEEGRTSLKQLAFDLDGLIFERFGEDTSIDLLGFSMGGVVSRVWLQQLGGASRTRSFISVGTPHCGTFTAQLVPSWLRQGIADMKRGSFLLNELNRDSHLLQEVKCSSYFCRWDLVVFPGWQAILPIGSSHSVPVLTHKELLSNPKSIEILGNAIISD